LTAEESGDLPLATGPDAAISFVETYISTFKYTGQLIVYISDC
jgi:hypothetical protein